MNAHTAILGMSFSGSTVLNYCLGSLPGCATISESHWLVEEHPAGRRPSCRKCGKLCAVLTDDFRENLKSEPQYYDAIRARLDVDHLFSSDKNLKIYDRLEPGRNFSAVVLFKDPLYQLNSWFASMTRRGRHQSDADCEKFLRYYVRYYRELLNAFIAGTKLFLSCHDFQTQPEAMLRVLCQHFRLQFDSCALRYWETDHHAIGGNFSPYQIFRKGGQQAACIRDLRPRAFDERLKRIAQNYTAASEIYAELMALRIG